MPAIDHLGRIRARRPVGAFPGEEVLWGEDGGGAEVGAAELGDMGGGRVGELVAPGHGFDHPRVDGEGFELASAKAEDAVGDFSPDAGGVRRRVLTST